MIPVFSGFERLDTRWSINGTNPRVLPVSLIFVCFLSPLLAWGLLLSSVALGNALVHKQTFAKELRRTQRGWLPGTRIQRTCATGGTPLRNRRYQKTKILTSAVIKSNDSRSAVLPVEVDVFAALTVKRIGLNKACGWSCTITALRKRLKWRAMCDWIIIDHICWSFLWLFVWSFHPGRTSGRPTWSQQRRSPVWSSIESKYQQNWLFFCLANKCLRTWMVWLGLTVVFIYLSFSKNSQALSEIL